MSFLDRIKRMSGITRSRPVADAPPEPMPSITLDAREQPQWAEQLIHKLDLDDEFADFLEQLKDLVEESHEALLKLTAEESVLEIPERARTINALHGTEYAAQGKKLLAKAVFTNLFAFEEEHVKFQEAMNLFHDSTKRNVSALKEFLGPQLTAAEDSLRAVEDEILAMLKRLEERRFDHIRTIHEEQAAITQLNERRDKYAQLVQSLEEDRDRVRKRVTHIETEIHRQRALIRNDDATAALEELAKVETAMNDTINHYAALVADLGKYAQKNRIELPRDVRKLIDDGTRDTARVLAASPQTVSDALTAAATFLEQEGRGSVSALMKRLQDAAARTVEDGKMVAGTLATQKRLRSSVMRDVAAIAVYDQQQFLLRANKESQDIDRKLAFLAEELDPAKRITHERAIRDAALALGATIVGDDASEDGLVA